MSSTAPPIPPTERALDVPLHTLPPELQRIVDPATPFPDDRFVPLLELPPLTDGWWMLGGGGALIAAGIVAILVGLTRNVQPTLYFGAVLAVLGLGTLGWGLTRPKPEIPEPTPAEARRGGYLLDEGFLHWDGHRAAWIPRSDVTDLFNKVARPDSEGRYAGWYLTLADDGGAWQIPGSRSWKQPHVDRVQRWVDQTERR